MSEGLVDLVKIPVLAVVGPTASGKTALAVELAREYGGEVVSADSMQIYTGMRIATARPTEEEMQGVLHHMIGFLSPEESFSVADYTAMARRKIADIHAQGKLPVLCGGTGLYVNSLLDHVRFDDTGSDEAIRVRLFEFAKTQGNRALWERLHEVDEPTARELHPNNLTRVVRALEVYELTGERLSVHKRNSKAEPSPYAPVMIGLTCSDRVLLYERINRRVDEMLRQGLVAEANEFFRTYQAKTARQAIGIKELLPYFAGEADLDECIEKIKRETRHYAKRQLTWFRRDPRIFWIETDKYENLKKIIEKIKNIIAKAEII